MLYLLLTVSLSSVNLNICIATCNQDHSKDMVLSSTLTPAILIQTWLDSEGKHMISVGIQK